MTTTTTEQPTAEQLREQIVDFKEKLEEAELDLGRATLDGGDAKAATRRATEARTGIERTEAALLELERREAAEAEERRTGAASDARQASYRWIVAYMEAAEEFLLRRADFEAAEARLKGLGVDRKVKSAKSLGRYTSPEESDLDTALLKAIPDAPRGDGPVSFGKRFTPERARELRQFAEAFAVDEAEGRGIDRSEAF